VVSTSAGGTNIHGYRPGFGSSVRFVFLHGVEVGRATFLRWFVIYTIVLAGLIAAALGVAWRSHGRANRLG
jgi:hypothetical protein